MALCKRDVTLYRECNSIEFRLFLYEAIDRTCALWMSWKVYRENVAQGESAVE